MTIRQTAGEIEERTRFQQISDAGAQGSEPIKVVPCLCFESPEVSTDLGILERALEIGFDAIDPALRLPVVANLAAANPSVHIGRAASVEKFLRYVREGILV